MNTMMCMKAAMVFQLENLDLEGVKKDLTLCCGVNVTEVEDDELQDGTPVKVVYLDGSLVKMLALKKQYNCWELGSPYIWMPMDMNITKEDRKRYEEARKAWH